MEYELLKNKYFFEKKKMVSAVLIASKSLEKYDEAFLSYLNCVRVCLYE